MAASGARRNFRKPQFFGLLWRAGLRFGLPHPLEAVDLTLDADRARRHLRSSRRRLRALQRRRALARAAFREDALRQRAADRADDQAWRERKSPLYAQRVAETIAWLLREMVVEGRRRLRRVARRRQRGRGGQVLCLVARRDRGGAGRSGRRRLRRDLRRDGARQFRRPQHSQPAQRASSCATPTTEARLAAMRAEAARRGAPRASVPASTTRCSPTGTG